MKEVNTALVEEAVRFIIEAVGEGVHRRRVSGSP